MGEPCEHCGNTDYEEWWAPNCHVLSDCKDWEAIRKEMEQLKLQIDGLKKEIVELDEFSAEKLKESNRLVGELQNKLAEVMPIAMRARDFWASDNGDTDAERKVFEAVEKFEGKGGNDLFLWDIELSKSQKRKCVCGTGNRPGAVHTAECEGK